MGASTDWQKIDPDLRSHPAFAHLTALLGLSAMETHGLLAGLWAMAYRQAEDGDLSRFKPGAVAAAVGYAGNAREMLAALTEAGFLDDGDGKLVIHDWEDWGGALFAYRERDREYQRVRYHLNKRKSHSRTDESRRTSAENPRISVVLGDRERESKSPLTPEREDALGAVETVDNSFEDFWRHYPNKQGKVPAQRTWKHLKLADRTAAIGIAMAMTQAVERGYRDRAVCPHGSTFLNQRRWEEWEDGPPPGYGPVGREGPVAPTTEEARPTCFVCKGTMSADDVLDGVYTTGGWRHERCPEGGNDHD